MPPKKCMISSFACHETGASSIVYAPLNQILITGGKKGEICIFDMRQRVQRDRFQAHEGVVKCIALDPGEEFFATGSSDGDIKVNWKAHPFVVAPFMFSVCAGVVFGGAEPNSTIFVHARAQSQHLFP